MQSLLLHYTHDHRESNYKMSTVPTIRETLKSQEHSADTDHSRRRESLSRPHTGHVTKANRRPRRRSALSGSDSLELERLLRPVTNSIFSPDEERAFRRIKESPEREQDGSDSDSDPDFGSGPGGERLLMRAWFTRQVESGDIPGLVWHDKDKSMIEIPWKHGSRQTWDMDKDSELFRRWAEYTGRYDPRRPDAKKWKANFRCALNSLPDVREMKSLRKKGQRAYKVYQLDKPRRRTSIVTKNKSQGPNSPVQRARCPRQSEQHKSMPQTDDTRYLLHSPNIPQGAGEHAAHHVSLVEQTPPLQTEPRCDVTTAVRSGTDHAYAHVHASSFNTTAIPEPVLQMTNDVTGDILNEYPILYVDTSVTGTPVRMDYALDGSCSPDGSSSGTDSFTEDDYHRVTKFLLNNKDQLPEEITGGTKFTVLQPVNHQHTCAYDIISKTATCFPFSEMENGDVTTQIMHT